MAAYFWTRACPGTYYLWDGPKESGRKPIAKVQRQDTGVYGAKPLIDGLAFPPPPPARQPKTPIGGMEFVEQCMRQAGDTFTAEGF
jgi:hypothetical protein